MKLVKKITALAVSSLMMFSIAGMNVFAASTTQDGLEVSLTTDKETYSKDEKITATLSVKNTNKAAVNDVTLKNVIPNGYEISNDSSANKSVQTLEAGASEVLVTSLTAIKEKPESSEESSKNVEVNPNLDVPPTGDNDKALYIAIFVLVAAFAVTVVCVKNKKGKQLLSLFLCVALMGAILPLSGSLVSAKTVSRQIAISEKVKVDSNALSLDSIVSYNLITAETENLTINLDGTLYDDGSKTYYQPEEMPTLTGTLGNVFNVKKANCTVKDVNGNVLVNKDFDPEKQWTVDDFALIVGENTVTVSVEYTDGTKDEKTVKINNINEKNMDPLNVDKNDDDKDGVLNFIEELYHTDPKNEDSDKDGLTDYYEMAILGTDPNKPDTDGNGVSDADEDADRDDLTNIDEIKKYNTDPTCIDSDGDTISDSDEINKYKTDPNKADSDGDKASDGWEVYYGFDPLTPNSDFGNYSFDGNSVINNDDGSEITAVLDNEYIKSAPGYMGVSPIYIELKNNTQTNISIPFDTSNIDSGDVPTIYYFDEKTQTFEEVPTTISDDGTATTTVNKSGTYVLLNRRYVYDVWENDILTETEKIKQGNADIVFVVDCSPSMSSNDPDKKRQQVITEFVKKLRQDDKAAIVTFTNKAKTDVPLTSDKSALTNAIDNGAIYADDGSCGSDSGTNGAAGLRYALNELLDKKKSKAPNKYIVFLADGVDDHSENQEFYNTYPEIEADASENGIIIHTIGLVGTGSVDIDLLKEIANKTGGNYYLATAGTAPEKDEYKDALPLEDVYKEIATETLDEDSNHDGISDYLTRLMCEGKILDSRGRHLFGGADYETVQSVEVDFDGDGLANGEEIELASTKNYFIVHSLPYKLDSDGDGINDYDETKVFGTSCLKYNANVRKTAVDLVTNNDYYQSSYWREKLKSNCLLKGSVYIGNAFYGSTLLQEVFYEKVLLDFFTDLNKELFNSEVVYNYQAIASSFTEAAFKDDFKKCLEAAEKDDGTLMGSIQELTGKLDEFCNVASIGENASDAINGYNELLNIANGSQAELNYINNILAKVETNLANLAFTIDDSEALNNYAKTLQSIKGEFTAAGDAVKVKMNSTYLAKLGRGIDTVDNGVKEALPIIDKAAKVGDIVSWISIGVNGIVSISDACEEYSGFMSNLEIMQKNIYVLDAICAQTDDPLLFSAASNMRYNVQTSMNDLLSNVSLVTDKFGNAVISIELDVLHWICQKIPYTMPFEIVRTIGNAFLHTADAAETITKSVAAAEIADVLSKHYLNSLTAGNASDGNGAADRWVAYHDYSADLYIYLLNLSVIRRNSEKYVIEKRDIGIPNETITNCESMIDSCNGIIVEYLSKLIIFEKMYVSD